VCASGLGAGRLKSPRVEGQLEPSPRVTTLTDPHRVGPGDVGTSQVVTERNNPRVRRS
jgi:hypothetical protein